MISLKEALIDRSIQTPIKNTSAIAVRQSFTLGSDRVDSSGLPITYNDELKDGIYFLSKNGKILSFKLKPLKNDIIRNLDLQKLSDAGVELIRANSGKKYYPYLYLKPNTTIPNNIKIEPVLKDQNISLSIDCRENEILDILKSLNFENNINLPYCSFYHPSLHLNDDSHYKTYEYLRDIIINKNLFLGYGVETGSNGIGLFSNYMDRYKNFEHIEDIFNKIDRYSNDKSLENLSNMPTNVPFFAYTFMVIRLDGSIKGSIEKDIKYWWDERCSKNPTFTKMKVFQNQYLFMT